MTQLVIVNNSHDTDSWSDCLCWSHINRFCLYPSVFLQVASVTPVTSVARSINTTAASRSIVTCMQLMVTSSFYIIWIIIQFHRNSKTWTWKPFISELSLSPCHFTAEAVKAEYYVKSSRFIYFLLKSYWTIYELKSDGLSDNDLYII